MTSSLGSRYHHTVDVILEEGSSDDDDFIEQEARIQAELEQQQEQPEEPRRQQQDILTNGSRPPFCEGQEAHKGNAYGEAVDILDQALIACDQEFAEHQQNELTRFFGRTKCYKSGDEMALPALSKSQGIDNFLDEENKVLSPSNGALDNGQLFPCPYCGRTFLQKALERHMKICQKVSTKKRNVFDLAKKRTEGLDPVPASKEPVPKRKLVKAEDEFQKCPICGRKFGDKAYDRHVKWCTEKARRMQTSPKKDMEAIAKLKTRVLYRPNTPNSNGPSRKESTGSGGSPSRKTSNNSMDSDYNPDLMTRSLSRSSMRSEDGLRRRTSFSGTKSLGRSSGISFLKDTEHTIETPETNFIRNTTGRGSIKKGPAPTRASVLRAQKLSEVRADVNARSKTPNCPLHNPPPRTPTLRRRAPSPGYNSRSYTAPSPSYNSRDRYAPSPSNSTRSSYDYPFQALVKPSVVRPSRSSSYGMRREPEGIEHDTPKSSRPPSALLGGHYDHSQAQEYDPYQSAAKQMQELLFGSGSGSSKNNNNNQDDLKPSSNSAFQKYVPSANVPSTAELNSKLSSSASSPRRQSLERQTSFSKPGWNSHDSHASRMAAKVAKFCHECGNSYPLPEIRFCCECGVKRLYV